MGAEGRGRSLPREVGLGNGFQGLAKARNSADVLVDQMLASATQELKDGASRYRVVRTIRILIGHRNANSSASRATIDFGPAASTTGINVSFFLSRDAAFATAKRLPHGPCSGSIGNSSMRLAVITSKNRISHALD